MNDGIALAFCICGALVGVLWFTLTFNVWKTSLRIEQELSRWKNSLRTQRKPKLKQPPAATTIAVDNAAPDYSSPRPTISDILKDEYERKETNNYGNH